MEKIKNNSVFKTFLFVLPYIFIEFTNVVLVTIDKSMSNSIGKTAIIVFSSFLTLNWAINTIQTRISSAHTIVLARDRKNANKINSSAMLIELLTSLLISCLIFIFSKEITYVYNLEDDAREILSIILKLKAIQLPILSLGFVPRNILKINEKTNKIWIVTVVASLVNILGDYISIKFGYNEVGIYVATIISQIIRTTMLIIFAKYKMYKPCLKYIKQILYYAKDLIFNKIIQRIVNIYYTSVASSFGTDIYAIHCVCGTIADTFAEISEGYYTGLLVDYSKEIETSKKGLLKKVDKMEMLGMLFAILLIPIFIYPLWLFLGRNVSWESCNPYIWFYAIEFIMVVAGQNYSAYLAANKNTKSISMMAFVGIQKFNIGLIGLAFACGIDRFVRAIYLRLYIKVNKKKLLV